MDFATSMPAGKRHRGSEDTTAATAMFQALESLEPRVLLTTVTMTGGIGVFAFEDSTGGGNMNVAVVLTDPDPTSTAQVSLLDASMGDIDPGDDIAFVSLTNTTPTTRLAIMSIDNSTGDFREPGTGPRAIYDFGTDGIQGGSGQEADILVPSGGGSVRITDSITTDGPMDRIVIDGTVGIRNSQVDPPEYRGTVMLQGPINLFYCGYLDADFTSTSDVGELQVATSVGGGVQDADGNDVYRLGNINIQGTLGALNVGGSLYKNVDVGVGIDQSYFQNTKIYTEKEQVSGSLADGRLVSDRNDTAAEGEVVATSSGSVYINGNIEGQFDLPDGTVVTDFADAYRLPLRAGQEVTIGISSAPMGVAAGDFDGDGTLDYVSANSMEDTITVVLRSTPVVVSNYATGRGPLNVAVADFDGANGLDVAVTNSIDDTVTVLFNDGTGLFDQPVTLNVGDQPNDIVATDIDGDGDADLLVTNTGDDNVSVLLGDGAGGFAAATNFAVGDAPQQLVVGNWDGDANQDIAVANQGDDTVSVLLGTGGGNFGAAVAVAVGDEPYGVAAGDLDQDTNPDLVVTNSGDGTFTVLFGQGAGTFGSATAYTTGGAPMGVVVSDFDQDGWDDVAVVASTTANAEIWSNDALGAGDLVQSDVLPIWQRPVGIVAGDFDGNGDGAGLAVTDADLDAVDVYTNAGGIFTHDDITSQGVGRYNWVDGTVNFVLTRPDGTWIDYGSLTRDIVWTPDVNDTYVLFVVNQSVDDTLPTAGVAGGFVGTYQIDVTGMGTTGLGSINVAGDIGNDPASAPEINVWLGDLGDVTAGGNIVNTTIDVKDGSLTRIYSPQYVGTLTITTQYDIGLISGDDLPTVDLLAKRDIQEIRITNDLATTGTSTIAARRNIGQIVVGNDFLSADVQANVDGVGERGFIDLVDVGNNLGQLDPALTVTFSTGVGGDLRFLNVGNEVYVREGLWTSLRTPTNIDDTSPADMKRIVDDSGGVITLDLQPGTTASYLTYPVEGGVGVAIINLTINGPADASVGGDVQIGRLEVNPADAADTYSFSGTAGALDVFHLVQTGTVESISNTTDGSVLLAEVATLNNFTLHGNLGVMDFATGATAQLHSEFPNPVAPGGGTVDGLYSSQDVGDVRVYGQVHDVIVEGTLGSLVADADNATPAGEFDGITGFVYGADIGLVDVGDGLPVTPASQFAEVGIFSTGTISEVRADGSTTVVEGGILGQGGVTTVRITGGASFQGRLGAIDLTNWLWVADLSGVVVTGPIGNIYLSGDGADITDAGIVGTQLAGISASGGTDGIASSDIRAGDLGIGYIRLDGPGLINSDLSSGGNIDGLVMTGTTGAISGSSVYARSNIRSISAFRVTTSDFTSENTVGSVTVRDNVVDVSFDCGGFGTMNVRGLVTGLDLEAAGPVRSVIVTGAADGSIQSTGPFANIGTIRTGGMNTMTIVCEGRVGSITTTRGNDMTVDLSVTGRNAYLGRLVSGGDLQGTFMIEGSVQEITANGALASAGQLIYIDGDAGRISTRVLPGGAPVDIAANIIVNGVLRVLDSAGGISGRVEARDGIQRLVAHDDVTGTIISNRDIRYLQVIGGDLNGPVTAVLDIWNVDVRAVGGVGGNINGAITSTFGLIRSVRSTGGDINGAITAERDVNSVYVRAVGGVGGNINGAITSTVGTIRTVRASGGDVNGAITAEVDVWTVNARATGGVGGGINGNIRAIHGKVRTVSANGGAVAGNVRAFLDVRSVRVTGAGISGNITSDAASVRTVYARGGDVSGTITAAEDIWSVTAYTVAGGPAADLSGNFLAGRDIKRLTSHGGDLTGTVVAGRDIQYVSVRGSGDVTGQLQAGGTIRSLMADTATGATVAAGMDITRLTFSGDVDSSFFLAGYDTGADLLVGGGDDVLLGGDVGTATFRGDFINSVLAAGVGPGANGLFEGNGSDDQVAAGESSIRTVTINGTAVDGALASYGIFADTSVGRVRENRIVRNDGYVEPGTGRFKVSSVDGADVVPAGTFPLAQGTTVVLTDAADGDTVTVRLSGPGNGTVSTDTGNLIANRITTIQLDGVSSARTSLTVTVRRAPGGDGVFSVDLVEMGDDDGLRTLNMRNVDLNGSGGFGINMDGKLGTLTVGNIANGAALNIGDDLGTLTATTIGNADITVGGAVGNARTGAYAGGTFTARDLSRWTVRGGDLGAAVNVTAGKGRTYLTVTGGDVAGNVTTEFDLMAVTARALGGAGGNVAGNVTSNSGKVGRVEAYGGSVTGNVTAATEVTSVTARALSGAGGGISGNVTAGTAAKRITTSGGDLTGDVVAGTEVTSVTARALSGAGGGISGNVTAGTSARRITTSGGDLTGDVTAGQNVDLLSVTHGDVLGSAVSAGGNIRTVRVTGSGDLTNSTIAARFDITGVSLVNMTNSLVSAGRNLRTFRATGDITDSDVLAGYWIGPDMTFQTGDDVLGTGDMTSVSITGDMTGSSFAAGVAPGTDGLLGTNDDGSMETTSQIRTFTIRGQVIDTGGPEGILAATSLGRIRQGTLPLNSFGSFVVDTRPNNAGGPRVLEQTVTATRVILRLSDAILPETLDATTFIVEDSTLTPLTAASITFNPTTLEAIFDNAATILPEAYTITLVGTGPNPVTDRGGRALDGEAPIPSGNGIAGGDFVGSFDVA